MSFWSSLLFYRPTKPPIVMGKTLAAFVGQLQQIGILKNEMLLPMHLKFGESIDQDDRPTSWEEPITEDGLITTDVEIEWDVEKKVKSLEDIIQELGHHTPHIYRASISLGVASRDVIESLQRLNSPQNKHDLSLHDCWLNIGPQEIYDLNSEESALVGWMSLSLCGPGYLYPWTFPELVSRAEACQKIVAAAKLCRSTWPVEPSVPPVTIQEARMKLGELWPYADFNLPWDWYWGIAESG